MKKEEQILFDFSTRDQFQEWRTVNDRVMGGLSDSELIPGPDHTAIFQGTISLENEGGFCSTQKRYSGQPLEKYQGIALRVKGNGKTYQLRLRVDDEFDGLSYRHPFEAPGDIWTTKKLPFEDFEAVFRGRILESADPISPGSIRQIGFLIADKQAGPFRLEVDWLKAYS